MSPSSSTPDQPAKIFTLEEANRALAQAAPLVERLQGLQRSIVETNEHLDEATRKLSQGNGYPIKDVKAQLQELTQRQLGYLEEFQQALERLESLGAVLKDLNMGLIDFYGHRQGELVFLCWRRGEEEIRFWHRLEEGFAGRQPLE